MRVNDEIVDPQMCFGFMTSNNVFNGEKSEERRSCGPVWEPFRQSSECTWQYFIGLNDLKVEKGESQECDWSPFALGVGPRGTVNQLPQNLQDDLEP